MNKRTYYFLVAITVLLLHACSDTLNPEAVTELTKQNVIYGYGNTQSTVNALYTFLPDGLSYIDGAMMSSASDEAEFTAETNSIQKFNTGAWNAIDNPDGAWSKNFSGIYATNLVLINCDSVKMDYLKYNTDPSSQQQYQTNLSNMHRWKYEARFLRAFFYFELVKRYGGVPIFTRPLSLSDDFKNIPRDSLSKCVRFIVNECDSAASVLPNKYADDELGRATKGAALALKSRVLLYAASDLFNDPTWAGGYSHPELISMADNKSRQTRWQDAANAAADAITLITGSGYSLDASYSNVFRSYTSPEIILAKRYGSSNSFEITNYPVGYYLGNSGNTPTQNLVDDYEMKSDGSAFDWNIPSEASNPYSNRDSRLGFSILTNNAQFKGRAVQTYTGGADGNGVTKATKTGYYINKYIDPNLDLFQGYTSVHTWIIIRLAEIYLNYAEAVNEVSGPNGKAGVVTMTARQAISNTIRKRVGLKLITTTDKDLFRNVVRHERRIELVFEDHRLWDVRRWKIADSTLGVPIRGVEITKSDATFSYKVFNVENRVFENKMYFYPIPQKELGIAKGWVQNPLW
jgi:hypothetical protein